MELFCLICGIMLGLMAAVIYFCRRDNACLKGTLRKMMNDAAVKDKPKDDPAGCQDKKKLILLATVR